MAYTYELTSPKSGQTYEVEFDQQPGEADMEEAVGFFDTEFYKQNDLNPEISQQTPLASAAVSFWKGLGDVATGTVGGAAKLLDAGTDLVAKYTGTEKGGLFENIANFSDALAQESARTYPVNPANSKSATIGSGAAQGLGMFATAAAAGAAGVSNALVKVPTTMAGAMGGGEGIDTARQIGVETPEAQLAMGLLFSGVELGTERLGGLGGKAATERLMDLYRKPAQQILKEAAKTATSESAEEVIAGSAQDLLTRAFAMEDPNRPGFTKTGVELPQFDRKMLERRGLEALGGAAGGAAMAGVQVLNNAGKPEAPQTTSAIVTSPITGRSYEVEFDGQPNQTDYQEAAQYLDAQGLPGDAELKRDLNEAVQGMSAPLRDKALQYGQSALADPDAFFAAYESQHGNVVDADEMRRMLQPEGLNDGDFTLATDPVVAALSREYIRRRMAQLPEDATVAFLAGGPASGKSYARAQTPEITGSADLVIDAPMATYANAKKAIEAARDKGANVIVQYIHTPVEKATRFMLDRFQREGRETSASKMADMHFRAQQTALKLAREYAGAQDVGFTVTDMSTDQPQILTANDLQALAYPTLDETRQRIETTLDNEIQRRRQETDFWTPERQARVRAGDRRPDAAGHDQGPVSQAEGGPGASSLKEWGKTTFGQRLQADERLRESWRQTVGGQYRIESEAEWQGRANAFIEDNGIEGAFTLLMDPESGLSPSDQIALGLQLILSLDAEVRAAELTGDTERAAMLDDMLYETAEAVQITGTKLGQGVRVFGMWTKMSAQGVLAMFERKVNEARENDMELKLGERPEDIAADVEETARETRDEVAAEALGETDSDQLAQLQAQIEQLRQQLAQLTQEAQAAQQSTATASTPAEAVKTRKTAQDAEKRRQKKQRELKRMEARQERKAARKTKPRTERRPRQIQPDEMAWRWIDRMNFRHVSGGPPKAQRAGALAQHIRDYIKAPADALPDFNAQVRNLGLEPSLAVELQRMLDMERKHIADMAKERAISRLIDQLTPAVALPATRANVPRFVAKLFQAYELGAMDRPEFLEAYAQTFELPVFDAETRKKITALIKAQKEAPEGFLKQQATTELMAELSRFEGVKALDVAYAYWYANLLSGFGTQAVNIWGNAWNLIVRMASVGFSHNPRETQQFFIGMLEGAARGYTEGKAALKDGSVPYRGDLSFSSGQVLELLHSDNPQTWRDRFKNGLALGRWVFRALSAADAFFYHTNREGAAYLAAARYATSQQRLNGGDLRTYIAEQLNNTPEMWKAAVAQAEAEIRATKSSFGFGEVDRRAAEILDAMRPPEVVQVANRFGSLGTFTQDPEGLFGQVALATKALVNSIRIETAQGVFRPLQLIIPFVNIICNTTSRAFDLTPVGIARGVMGHPVIMAKGFAKGQRYDNYLPEEARDKLVTGILGTALGGLVGALALAYRDDDDDRARFMIYGMGPDDKVKRQQMPQGWRPFSIKIGDTYWSYSETPFAYLFGVIGSTMDRLRYSKDNEDATTLQAMTLALLQVPEVSTKTGAFSGFNEFMKVWRGEAKLTDAIARPVSGLIPAQGFLRDVNKLMQVPKLEATTITGAIFKDVPVVGEYLNRPALNIFGETVPTGWPAISRIVNAQKQDPEALFMARERLWIPGYDDKLAVGQWLPEAHQKLLKGAAWRTQRIAHKGATYAGVMTPAERYELIKEAGPGIRTAIREIQAIKASFPEATTEQLQERLNAKVVAQKRLAMLKVLGMR